MTARKADGLTGCREDGVTAYRGERAPGGPAAIQWEGGVPIYTVVIVAFVFHLAAR